MVKRLLFRCLSREISRLYQEVERQRDEIETLRLQLQVAKARNRIYRRLLSKRTRGNSNEDRKPSR